MSSEHNCNKDLVALFKLQLKIQSLLTSNIYEIHTNLFKHRTMTNIGMFAC